MQTRQSSIFRMPFNKLQSKERGHDIQGVGEMWNDSENACADMNIAYVCVCVVGSLKMPIWGRLVVVDWPD